MKRFLNLCVLLLAGFTFDATGGCYTEGEGCDYGQQLQFNYGYTQQFVQPFYAQQFAAPVYTQQFVQPYAVQQFAVQSYAAPVVQSYGYGVQQFAVRQRFAVRQQAVVVRPAPIRGLLQNIFRPRARVIVVH